MSTETTPKTMTVDAERFKKSVFVRTRYHRWGNRAKVTDAANLQLYLAQKRNEEAEAKEAGSVIQTETEATVTGNSAVSSTKRLLQSDALKAINDRMNSAKKQIALLCVPSTVQPGMFVASPTSAMRIQAVIESALSDLSLDLVPKFEADYSFAIERARTAKIIDGGLGPLFNPNDYPPIENVTEQFDINCFFWSLKVPDNLPAEMRAEQQAKLEKTFNEAAEAVTLALREGLAGMIQHATERLTPGEDGKKKIFKDTLLGNIQEFCDCFSDRNIMNDEALAALVSQAKEVLTGIRGKEGQKAADVLRSNDEAREAIRQKFAGINQQLGAMITEQRERALNFDDDASE